MLSPGLLLARNEAFGWESETLGYRYLWFGITHPADGRIGLSVHMGYSVP